MQFSSKIRIDHTIGRIFCYGLFPLIRLIGLLLQRDHSIQEHNVRCIVVAKYYGMGSIIHATPMLAALKSHYPHARLVFVTRKNNKSLFSHLSDVDEVLYINDDSFTLLVVSTIKLISNLIQRHVDLFFDLELFSSYGALVSLFSLARNRLGFLCGLDTDFKTYLYTHLMYFNFQMPVRLCYLQLARIAGALSDLSDLVKPVIDAATYLVASEKLERSILPDTKVERQRLLAININVTDFSVERRWLPERFEAVARHFARQGYQILFVGSQEERHYVQGVVDRINDMPGWIHNVAGNFTFSEFLALLEKCDALLTTDTGIMNFAYALEVPTVSLWGPDNPIQYHVEKESTRAIWKSAYCSPCIYRFNVPPCGGNNVCMTLIGVDEVVSALNSLLKGEQGRPSDDIFPVCVDSSDNPLGLLRDRSSSKEKI